MTHCKMDEENLAGIMFCFPNCNLFEGSNGCRIKTSWAAVRFHCVSPRSDWWTSLPRLTTPSPTHVLSCSPLLLQHSASLLHFPRVYWEFGTLAMDPGACDWFFLSFNFPSCSCNKVINSALLAYRELLCFSSVKLLSITGKISRIEFQHLIRSVWSSFAFSCAFDPVAGIAPAILEMKI